MYKNWERVPRSFKQDQKFDHQKHNNKGYIRTINKDIFVVIIKQIENTSASKYYLSVEQKYQKHTNL